jgi:hypothetical protein
VDIDGVAVECVLDTEYPFKNSLRYTIRAERAVTFTLAVRIPGCAEEAWLDGEAVTPGGFAEIRRVWEGEQTLEVRLAFRPRLVARPGGMTCLWNGPLLYALPIQTRWVRREYERDGVERKFPYCDYELLPESDWNFGFAGDRFEVREDEVSTSAFSQEHPPVRIAGSFAPIPWREEWGVCAEAPEELTPIGATREMELIPYGCARLRMTEMPLLE